MRGAGASVHKEDPTSLWGRPARYTGFTGQQEGPGEKRCHRRTKCLQMTPASGGLRLREQEQGAGR